jgi:hypothetical protein
MARYTQVLSVALSPSSLRQQLVDTLKTCHLEVVHSTDDYMMARETPNGIPFAQLVSVEVLIDKTTATDACTQFTFVIKNEELPLKIKNHCFQVYERLSFALSENKNWPLLTTAAGAS